MKNLTHSLGYAILFIVKFKIKEIKRMSDHVDNFDNDEGIVSLYSANGEKIDFLEIAGIAYQGNFYAILQPTVLLEGMDEDEALVFKVTRGEDGEDRFEIELDDDIIDAVFKEYDKLYEEYVNNQNN